MSEIPEVAALRLVLVQSRGEGHDLVSLTHRLILASGDDLSCDDSVPVVEVGPVEEAEAAALVGVAYGEGWPGWEVLFPWLDTKVPPKGDGDEQQSGS